MTPKMGALDRRQLANRQPVTVRGGQSQAPTPDLQPAYQNALSDLQAIQGNLQGIHGDLQGIRDDLQAIPGHQ